MSDQQIDIASRLQEKLLKRFEQLLDAGDMSPTDAATLCRLLCSNGWNLDPSKVPAGLRGLLTRTIDPTKLDADDTPGGAPWGH